MGALTRFLLGQEEERLNDPLPFDTWMSYLGIQYPLYGMQQTLTGTKEEIPNTFGGYVSGAYKSNGVVFACMLARQWLLSEARFQFQSMAKGRPGDLYGTPALQPLETPWPTGTTGGLLTRAEQDSSLAGNFFGLRVGGNIKRLRPDWVTLVLTGENGDPDTEILGLIFEPGGPGSGREPMSFTREQFMHFAPLPDPIASFRGMSWITPIIREILADSAATSHKETSFQNGATPNMIVKLEERSQEKFDAMVKKFREGHEGVANAYKTLFLASGADATVVGQSFQQMTFKELQGSAETRIAAASGVHPVVVALSEGLQGSSLNSGNFTAAARLTADKTLRPWWREFAGSAANIIPVPGGSRLWYDVRDVSFLQADVKDAAEIQQMEAITIKQLIDAGHEPESVKAAVQSQDWSLLKHTGLFSVQLQPPMPEGPPKPAALPVPASNGKKDDNQLAFATIIASAIRDKRPDVIKVQNQLEPTPVEVNVEAPHVDVAAPEVRVEPPAVNVTTPEVTVELETVAKMIGEVEARRILDKEQAEERQMQLLEELKPPPPAKMVRRIQRDENGLLELIVDEPEETG